MNFLFAGISLGFAAGISPGPLLTLVITRTLERGLAAGLRVAVAPLLTDLPIILITVLFFNVLPPGLETVLTVGGALFVLYLAWEIVRDARHAHLVTGKVASNANAASDIWRGMMVNLLSPHPWLFWIGVAAPLLTRAWQTSAWSAAGFLVGFYGLLIGSKALVTVGVTGGRRFLNDRWYQRLLLASALLLAMFGVRLLWQAVGPIVG
ncbi:LysE family transporter [Caldilinea sp.]|uniref:LysE family translocator n=1 Tax=Caldilinea sp. TaxID=2293560 RepID=UPI002BB8D30A|nr:LysE family transporter [Anaerolineales bacterium]HQY92741.1 LysE family transporter [Caldilinea sp.]